jgi:hypothetical protein
MKKLLLAAGIALALFPAVASAQKATDQKQKAIDYVLEQDIMYTRSNGDFEADAAVTRLEFTLAAVDVLEHDANFETCFRNMAPSLPVSFTLLFNDVPADEWYGKQLCMAMYDGMVAGDRNGNFRPYDLITVAEASKVLSRGYGLIYPAPMPTGKPWYDAPMLAMEMKGAISSTMKPQAGLTRGDMAMMLYALKDQSRFPLSRIIGYKHSFPVAEAPAETVTDVVTPVALAPLKNIAAANVSPLQKTVTTEGNVSVSATWRPATTPVMLPRPSHRLLRQRVLESRMRAVPATPQAQ